MGVAAHDVLAQHLPPELHRFVGAHLNTCNQPNSRVPLPVARFMNQDAARDLASRVRSARK